MAKVTHAADKETMQVCDYVLWSKIKFFVCFLQKLSTVSKSLNYTNFLPSKIIPARAEVRTPTYGSNWIAVFEYIQLIPVNARIN